MKFSLAEDEDFQLTKKEIEDSVDSVIDSSITNLTIKISKEIDNEEILTQTLDLIYEDLEEKRIKIKQFFISQLETMTKEAFQNALETF